MTIKSIFDKNTIYTDYTYITHELYMSMVENSRLIFMFRKKKDSKWKENGWRYKIDTDKWNEEADAGDLKK